MKSTRRGLKSNSQESRSETILGGFPFELLTMLHCPSDAYFPSTAPPPFFLPFFPFPCPIVVRGQEVTGDGSCLTPKSTQASGNAWVLFIQHVIEAKVAGL